MSWYIGTYELNGHTMLAGSEQYFTCPNPRVDFFPLPGLPPVTIQEFETEAELDAFLVGLGYKTRRMYYNEHRVCPRCRNETYSTTYVGFVAVTGMYHDFQDENQIECKCGFKGITHDLVPKKENKND